MPKFIDEEGNEVEAVPIEEVNEKVEQAKTELQAQHDTEKAALEAKLKETTAQLDGISDKNVNFKALREAKEAADARLKQFEEGLDKKVEEKTAPIFQQLNEEKLDKEIDGLVGSNEELKKKVKFYYNSFTGKPATPEEFKERVKNAHLLATGGQSPSPFSGGATLSSGGLPGAGMKGGGEGLTPKQKEIAKAVFPGLDNDDLNRKV